MMQSFKQCSFCAVTTGLQPNIHKFLLFYLTLSLTTVAGAAIAFTFSALVSVFAVANLLVSLVFVFYMVSSITMHGGERTTPFLFSCHWQCRKVKTLIGFKVLNFHPLFSELRGYRAQFWCQRLSLILCGTIHLTMQLTIIIGHKFFITYFILLGGSFIACFS